MRFLKTHSAFLVILLAAALLRFWNLAEADFSHDELSALYRTQFDSLAELIEKGIRIDGHPALTQVFLYYWAPWVEYQEFWVKLPSVLLGLASIILVYLSGRLVSKKKEAALLAPALMASSELFVYYHQIARPYAWGAFFVAWTAYAYLKWFYKEKQQLYLWEFSLASALAAYSHYIALLSVLIIGIGALWRDRRKPKPWLAVSGAVLILFSPHLSIFWGQLKLGGVGQWLAAPSPAWILDFFAYALNYFYAPWAAGILMLTILIFRLSSKGFREAWLWWGACFSIAFLYSVYRNPVLQFSSLIFLSPYIFILPSNGKVRAKAWWILCFATLTLLSFYLIREREYFQEAQLSPAKETGRFMASKDSLEVYYHWSPEKWQFYRQIDSLVPEAKPIESIPWQSLEPRGFYLLMDHQSPGFWPLALVDHGYEILRESHHFGFSLYEFGGLHQRSAGEELGFRLMEEQQIPEQNQQYIALGELESFTNLADKPQSQVVVKFDQLNLDSKAHLVFQIRDGEEQIAWFAHPIDSNTTYLSRPVGNYGINEYNWKVLIDQGPQAQLISGEISIRLSPGNPKVYGLVQDF